MKTPDILQKLLTGKNLKEREAYHVFHALFKQQLSPTEAKLLLVCLSEKGEVPVEVLGCLKALRKLEPADRINISRLMDTCGTGGDGSQTFNISTVAALVVAGAGGLSAPLRGRWRYEREAMNGLRLVRPHSEAFQSPLVAPDLERPAQDGRSRPAGYPDRPRPAPDNRPAY